MQLFGLGKKDESGEEFKMTPIPGFRPDYTKDFEPLITDVVVSIDSIKNVLHISERNKNPTLLNDSTVTSLIIEQVNSILNNMSDTYYNILLHYKNENGIIDYIATQLTIQLVEAGVQYNKNVLFSTETYKEE